MIESSTTLAVNAEDTDIHQTSVGRQLQLAREAKGLSLSQAADALKLGKVQVEAIEGDNWAALPGVTFIRGFVRNYGRLVGLDPVRLMEQLEPRVHLERPELVLPESTHTNMPAPASHIQPRDFLLAVMGLVLVSLAVLVYFLLPDDLGRLRSGAYAFFQSASSALSPASSTQVPPEAPVAQPAAEPVLPPGSTVKQVISPQAIEVSVDAPAIVPVQPASVALPSPGAQQQGVESAPTLGPESRSSAVPAAEALLHFSFSKETWVEVRDRRGNVVYAQNALAGSTRAIEGQAPFSLVIGNTQGVKVTFRGKPVDLTPHIRGDVARLTLE